MALVVMVLDVVVECYGDGDVSEFVTLARNIWNGKRSKAATPGERKRRETKEKNKCQTGYYVLHCGCVELSLKVVNFVGNARSLSWAILLTSPPTMLLGQTPFFKLSYTSILQNLLVSCLAVYSMFAC